MGTSFCPCINRENEKNEAIFGEPKLNEIKNQNSADIDMGKNKIVIKENNNNKKIFKKRKEFDKKLCELIFQSLPKRITSNLQQFKDFLKEKLDKVDEKEKAYTLFLWVCDNIVYDAESYFSGQNTECDPEAVFRIGKTVCSGYARLYKNIGEYIGLNIQCISCYSKGIGYEPGKTLTSTDHEYNIIKLNNQYYPIDCTWGAGTIQEKKFVKHLNEFYFLTDPELLIKTHFPANDRWQLTEKKYTLSDFLKWPQVFENFYAFGFNKYFPEEGFIELNSNTQNFIIWGNNISKNEASCNIFLLEGNIYQQQLNLDRIKFLEGKIEFDFIFNKKGRYKIKLFANNDKGKVTHNIMTYIVDVQKESINELKFPYYYQEAKEIEIIEPIYDNIKSGQNVKFKIKTNLNDLDTIIIIDGQWHYLNKDEQGFFEKEITIQTPPGKNIIIGKRKDNSDCNCSYLVAYTII